jgi:hypothetical protein
MKLFITCDFYWETKIDKVLFALDDTGYESFFEKQNYGSSLESISIVLMCQDPSLNLKKRVRYSKKDKHLYMDIMLDTNDFINVGQQIRNKIVAENISSQVIPIIVKYKLEDFDLPKFEVHLKKIMDRFIKQQGA